MILSSTSQYGLQKELYIACGAKDNAVFCPFAINFCPWLQLCRLEYSHPNFGHDSTNT